MSIVREVEFRAPVNQSLVEILEHMLDHARAGEVVSGNFAGTTKAGEVVVHFSTTDNRHMEIAAIVRLLHRLNLSCDEGSE